MTQRKDGLQAEAYWMDPATARTVETILARVLALETAIRDYPGPFRR